MFDNEAFALQPLAKIGKPSESLTSRSCFSVFISNTDLVTLPTAKSVANFPDISDSPTDAVNVLRAGFSGWVRFLSSRALQVAENLTGKTLQLPLGVTRYAKEKQKLNLAIFLFQTTYLSKTTGS